MRLAIGFSLLGVFAIMDLFDFSISEPVSISPTIIDSYRSYSYAVIRDKYTRRVDYSIGAAGYSTFGLGLLLAVLNEQLFEMDTYGFDNALKLPKSKIFNAYHQILKSLTSDDNVKIFNDIYSSSNYTMTENLKALNTEFTYIDYNTTVTKVNSAVAQINARIAVETFGKVYGTLIPLAGWYGNSFFNYTSGVLVNTFFYKGQLANKKSATTMEKFADMENVTFFETTGLPLNTPRDKFIAVRVPFKNSLKSLVLILPNNLTTFVKDDLEQMIRKVDTNTRVDKTVKIKIPALNFTVPTSYFRQLKKLGITESMCRYDQMKKNVFESAAQNVHVSFTEDFDFTVAAATGTHVNNVAEFLDIHNSDSEPQISEDDISQDDEEETNKEQLARLKSDLFSDDEIQYRGLNSNRKKNKNKNKNKSGVKSEETETETRLRQSEENVSVESEPTTNSNGNEDDIKGPIEFNKPFFFYLDDEILGPIFYGSVSSFKQYKLYDNDVPPPGHEWQLDGRRYLYWSCP